MPDDSLLLDQLAEMFAREVRGGGSANLQEYAKRYPALADRIRGLFPTLLMLEGFAQNSACTDGSLSEGQHFGQYHIIRLLGRGGMGDVYEAEDLESGRRVALKFLRQRLSDEADKNRFLAEGCLAASINHPHCVYVYASEEIDGIPVISMELLPGGTLKNIVEGKGPLPASDAVDAILQVIDGLAAAAETGILHRNIKPSNCFVDSDGTIKIGDFGLSISTLAHQNPLSAYASRFCGTPAFSSPEQLRCENLDVRADIYSVGATLYYLLTGRVPLEGAGLAQLWNAILDSTPKSPRDIRSGIPKGLAQIVLRCLKKRASARHPTYGALKEDLLEFSSRILKPARPTVRFFAAKIDLPWIWSISLQVTTFSYFAGVFDLSRHRSLFTAVDVSAIGAIYYALMEGMAGASLGKMALSLRVVDLHGKKPTFGAAIIRASVFGVVLALSLTLATQVGSRAIAPLLLLAVLFCCGIGRNGLYGLHDLASKTRVVQRSPTGLGLLMPPERANPSAVAEGQVGPYRILGHVRRRGHECLELAYDDRLHRNVWIVILPAGSPALPQIRRELSRPSRLRWLNGKRDPGCCWDAYEAPRGSPLPECLKQEPSRRVICGWLLGLAEELRAGQSDNTLSFPLSVDELWIRQDGRLILLDFPAAPDMA